MGGPQRDGHVLILEVRVISGSIIEASFLVQIPRRLPSVRVDRSTGIIVVRHKRILLIQITPLKILF